MNEFKFRRHYSKWLPKSPEFSWHLIKHIEVWWRIYATANVIIGLGGGLTHVLPRIDYKLPTLKSCITSSFVCSFHYIYGSVQDCSNSIANTLVLQQSCTEPSTCCIFVLIKWMTFKFEFNADISWVGLPQLNWNQTTNVSPQNTFENAVCIISIILFRTQSRSLGAPRGHKSISLLFMSSQQWRTW